MMFLQRYVHIVLDAVLGSYVKNIDPEALKISVWNGKIEVDVVELQPDAFHLPPEFRIVKGTLHQVRIDLPWSNLANQPICVDVQDVSLLLEVCDRRPEEAAAATAAGVTTSHAKKESDAHTAKRRAETLKRKRATIDAVEKATRYSNNNKPTAAVSTAESEGNTAKSKPWTQSFLFKLLVKVLDNVQLNIQHIHLRVEDHVSAPGRPFALGVTLESMVIKSADARWNYTMMVRGQKSPSASAVSFLRKKIDINNFGLYWSLPLAPVPQAARDDGFAFMRLMQMNFWSGDVAKRTGDDARYAKLFQPQDYVIQPLTLSLKLTINDGRAKLPITHSELSTRVMARLGTPWMVQTIDTIGVAAWQEFVDGMPKLTGDRMYTLSFVFSEAWAVAREHNEEQDDVPSVEQFKEALSSCLQWSRVAVERLESSIVKYRDEVIHVLQEKSTYIDASASVDHISVSIRRQQYLSGLNLLSFLATKRRQARYAHLRPVGVRVRENARAWWTYAISAVLVDVRERLARVDVEQVQQAKAKRVRYKELYLVGMQWKALALPAGLVSSQVLQLSKDAVKQEVDDLEVELDIQELLRLRRSARKALVDFDSKPDPPPKRSDVAAPSSTSSTAAVPDGGAPPPTSSKLWGYTAWMYGGGAADAHVSDQTGTQASTALGGDSDDIRWSDQDTKFLYDAIDFKPDESHMTTTADGSNDDGQHIWYRCQFMLGKTTLCLVDDGDIGSSSPPRPLTTAVLRYVDLKVLVRPKSVEVGVQLGDASVIGLTDASSANPRLVIQRMQVEEIVAHHPASVAANMSSVRLRACERVLPLIDINVELKSSKRRSSVEFRGASGGGDDATVPASSAPLAQEIAISVVAQAMTCEVNVGALLEVAAFFARPSHVDLSGLRERAWRQAQSLQRSSAAQLQAALTRRSNIKLLVDIISPLVTVRESTSSSLGNGSVQQRASLTMFLGHLRASSRRAEEQLTLHEVKYDVSFLPSSGVVNDDHLYDVIDVGISAIEVRLSDGLASAGASAGSTQLLEKTSIHIGIHVSIAASDPTIPLVKLIGGVDSVNVNLDAKTFGLLLRLLRSIGNDFSRSRLVEGFDDQGSEEPATSFASASAATRRGSHPQPGSVEASTAVFHEEDTFFSGFETETRLFSHSSSPPIGARRPSALYRGYSRIHDRTQEKKEASDSDLVKLWQRVLLLVRFQVHRVAVSLRLDTITRSGETKIIHVCIAAIETELDLRTYDKNLRFALGSFSVEEQRGAKQASRFLIASGDLIDGSRTSNVSNSPEPLPPHEQLIRLSISNVDVAAPKPKDFGLWAQLRDRESNHEPRDGQAADKIVWQDPLVTWLSVDARLRTLVLNLHQDAFADLFVFFYQAPTPPQEEEQEDQRDHTSSAAAAMAKTGSSSGLNISSGRSRVVRKVAKTPAQADESPRVVHSASSRRNLTTKIGTWVASSLVEQVSGRQKRMEQAVASNSHSGTADGTMAALQAPAASIQLRVRVAGLSLLLHQPAEQRGMDDELADDDASTVFIRLVAKDFNCVVHRLPNYLSVFAYLVSMHVSDETVPDESLREILGSETFGHGQSSPSSEHETTSKAAAATIAHVPCVADVLRAVEQVPAIFSCAAQLYGADRIQEQWHPGYANRFSVRLKSPRIRVLYRFLDDLRTHFVDGVLLQTVMRVMFPHRVEIEWDEDFLVSTFSTSQQQQSTHGTSPAKLSRSNPLFNASSDVVSTFPLLDIRLIDAKLIIPVHRTSTEALVVRFDLFRLTNEYLLDMFSNMTNRVMAKVLLNASLCQFKIDLEALRVVSVIFVEPPTVSGGTTWQHLPELLRQSLLGSTSMTLSADFSGGNATTIGIECSPLRLVCNREQYAFLFRLPIQNFGEARRRGRKQQATEMERDAETQGAASASTLPSNEPQWDGPGDEPLFATDHDEDERELVVTLQVPELALEILHGQEGYQPSLSGDMSMAEAEKRAHGSICVVHVWVFSSSVHYGLVSGSLRVTAELQQMRIRDTRLGAQISPTYRDVVVFAPPSLSGVVSPSISIRVLHSRLDASRQQERALECSFASPHRHLRKAQSSATPGSQDSANSTQPSGRRTLNKLSSSFFGSDSLVGFQHPAPTRNPSVSSSSLSSHYSKSNDSTGTGDQNGDKRRSQSQSSSKNSLSSTMSTSVRTDLVVDIEGFRVIPSNIHYDVLRFLESPGRGQWDDGAAAEVLADVDPDVDPDMDADLSVNVEKDAEATNPTHSGPDKTRKTAQQPLHYIVLALSLGKSAVLLVEDPSKALSRAVMFSWEASITVEFLRRPSSLPIESTAANTSKAPPAVANHRLQVRVDLTNIQATSRLSQDNLWQRAGEESKGPAMTSAAPASTNSRDEIAGDFLKPCDLEIRLDVDFASEFVRLKAAFDRVLDLRFGYLDVCSLRGALEKSIAFPSVPASSDDAPSSSSTARGRRLSTGSSATSSSGFDNLTMTASTAALSVDGGDRSQSSLGHHHRRRRRDRTQEPILMYGSTSMYLASATFRGPLNVRPSVGIYSSPWRKRYLVLPFTAQERQSVQPTMFRILPAAGSGRNIGDAVRFGDRIALQAVQSTDEDRANGDGNTERGGAQTLVCKYDQLGASGYLGPDGSAGVFETRIWKYGTSAFNSSRTAIRHKDPIVLEEVTIHRAFSKGKSFHGSSRLVSAQFDRMENGDNTRLSMEGGGYLMFNGVGDAPIPFVVSVATGSTMTKENATASTASTPSRRQAPPPPTAVSLWGKLKVFQFHLPGVNATVVNDFHNMLLPLLHLRVVQLTVDLRGSFESRLTAMAGLQVGVQSYNSQLAVWEPLVEDFDVHVAVHLKGGAVCEFCMSDRQQISLAGTKLRCEGIPTCLFGATKTAVFAAATARASETKHFIYQELLNRSAVAMPTPQSGMASSSSGDHGDDDDDAKLAMTCLLVIKKGINVNISRNGVNVLLQFTALVSRAASHAEQDAWQSRLGAYVYVDNQSGIPFMVAGHPSSTPPPTSSETSVLPPLQPSSSVDDDETVKLPTLSIGSEEGLTGVGGNAGGAIPGSNTSSSRDRKSALDQSGYFDNRQLRAVMKNMMSASTNWLTVQDGERLATSIVAHEAPAGSVTSPLRRLMWLRPKSSSSSSKPIPVPIGYSNRSYLHLESSTGFKDSWHGESIICETVAEQGTLVMRLRGKVQLVNHLCFPVQVRYNDKRREVLAANAAAPHFVPIQFLDGGNMTFCPLLASGQLQKSAPISIATLLRAPTPTPAQAKSAKAAAAFTGALEVRRVLTFYWDVHPQEHQSERKHDDYDEAAFFGVTRPPFQLILTASRKSEKHETLLTISPPIRLENLLPYPLSFRTVCTKSERDLAWVKENESTFSGTSGTVLSGEAGQICELEIFSTRASGHHAVVGQVPSAVALSVAVPTIGYQSFSPWCESSFIYGSDNLCTTIELTHTPSDQETMGGDKEKETLCPLKLRVEIVTTERLGSDLLNQLAPSVCRIYAEYWLIDRTCLSVVMRTVDGRRIIPWTEGGGTDGKPKHAPVALFSPLNSIQFNHKIKIGVRASQEIADVGVSDGGGGVRPNEIKSKAFDISTVGLRGQISLRAEVRSKGTSLLPSLMLGGSSAETSATLTSSATASSAHKQFDIGVMIEHGPSLFSRTTVVTFVPRYYFINSSDRFQIWIKQERDADANATILAPRQGCFFHWNDSRLRNRVQVRFVCKDKRDCCDVEQYDDDGYNEEEEEEDEDEREKNERDAATGGETSLTSHVHGRSEWSLPFEVASVGNFVIRLHRTLTRAASCFGEACFVGEEANTASSSAITMDSKFQEPTACETLAGMALHVGVELHDPAFVVRFHEGTSSLRGAIEEPAAMPAYVGDGTGQLDAAEVRDFVSFKVKNECTSLELFVWQMIPADASGTSGGSAVGGGGGGGASGGRAFLYEGGDRVFPFQNMDFVPFAATSAPVLHVQVQTLLETSSSLGSSSVQDVHTENKDASDDTTTAGSTSDSHQVVGLAPPRVMCSFDVALDKLHSLPVIEFHDGKVTKRLWVEVVLEDATKTLRVTDVLPGASSEHRRRRRAALLRSWKRYNVSVLWYSKLLHESHSVPAIPEADVQLNAAVAIPASKQRKTVRFANEDDLDDGGDQAATPPPSGSGGEASLCSETASKTPAILVAIRVVDALHLEDLYPPQTSVSGITPFLRVRVKGSSSTLSATSKQNASTSAVVTRSLRTQSTKAIFPRWVPAKWTRRKAHENESEVVLQTFSMEPNELHGDDDAKSEKDDKLDEYVEIEVREGNKVLFGSSRLGKGLLPLKQLLASLRSSSSSFGDYHPLRVYELLIPMEAETAGMHANTAREGEWKAPRSMVRVQFTAAVLDDSPASRRVLEHAIRDHCVEVQLDRLVRCKSQLKMLLERDSVDLALGDGASSKAAQQAHAQLTMPSPLATLVADNERRSTRGSIGAPSVTTDDSSSDIGGGSGDLSFDERVLSVVVVSVSNLLIPVPQEDVDDEAEEDAVASGRAAAAAMPTDQKVYCTVTYRESTRSATTSVAKPTVSPPLPQQQLRQPRNPRVVRTHKLPKGVKLGLDLIYHNGRVVVQGVACNGPCGKLLQDGEIAIGDTIVAVNDKSIVNLHRDSCFRAIAQACAPDVAAVAIDEDDEDVDDDVDRAPLQQQLQQATAAAGGGVVSLSFLRQMPSSFSAMPQQHGGSSSATATTDAALPRYEAEWNRRVEFVDAYDSSARNTRAKERDHSDKVLVRVYLRNEFSDHGLTAAHESSVVPFLYFFGDEDTMDHLDHSKEDTRFDKILGEAWVSLPPSAQRGSTITNANGVVDDDPLAAVECLCALYAPTSVKIPDPFFASTARAVIGHVRLALKWDFRNSLAQLKHQHHLRAYLQLEVSGVFISVIDDGNSSGSGGGQRRTPREVLSISLSARHADTGIQVCYGLVSDGRHVVNTRVGHLQVDNQLLDTNYPVMVFPIRLDDTVQQDQATTTAGGAASPSANGGGGADSISGKTKGQETARKFSAGGLDSAAPHASSTSGSPSISASPNGSGERILLPTFQLMGVFSKRRTLLQFEYIFAQLQELDVKIEDAVLVATAQALSGIHWSLLGSKPTTSGEQATPATATAGSSSSSLAIRLVDAQWPFPTTPEFPLALLNVQHRGGNLKVLLRWLLLCPIQVNVTFTSTTDRANLLSLVSPEMSSVLKTLISAAAALVSNLDNAAIKVPEFYVENLLETTHTLMFYTMQHYVHHGLRSWYRIVGSVDFLGNPIGLVSALGTGVKDFFYTPAQMLLEDEDGLRIENLRTGMTKGSKSLLRNTAVGIFHTTGKITETLGKGIALLAMDDDYNVERQRQTTRQKKKINDLGDAIAEGGKGLVGGVWDGVKGVVAAPVRGAERDGAGGFVVGIGQGVAGLFVKPAAGFLDMLTSLSRGAKSSAEAIDGGYDHELMAATRARLPRRICADGVLVAFSEREARGCAILALTSLDLTDDYVYHLDYGTGTGGSSGLLLLTDKRIICLSGKNGQKLWEVALDSSLQVETEATEQNGAAVAAATLKITQSKSSNKTYKITCGSATEASNFKLAVSSARLDLSATRYLLLNLEKKQEEAVQNALLFGGRVAMARAIGGDSSDAAAADANGSHGFVDDDGRVDLSLLMGNMQDTMVTGLTDQDLRTQPLRSVQVELCHLENKDAAANVPRRAIDRLLSFSVFQILVYGGPYQWTVYRRFSEFRDLYGALGTGHNNMDALPPLPTRTFLPSTRSSVATQRQEALSNFLQAAIMHSSISGSHAMLEFLTRSAYEVRVSLPPLSPTTTTTTTTAMAAAAARGGGGGGNGVGAASTSGILRTP